MSSSSDGRRFPEHFNLSLPELVSDVVALAVAVAFGLSFGLNYGVGNQTAYMLDALRLLDPSLLAGDWYAAETANFLILGIAGFALAHLLLGIGDLGELVRKLARQLGPAMIVIVLLSPLIFASLGATGAERAKEILFHDSLAAPLCPEYLPGGFPARGGVADDRSRRRGLAVERNGRAQTPSGGAGPGVRRHPVDRYSLLAPGYGFPRLLSSSCGASRLSWIC